VVGETWDEVTSKARERYDGLLDRVSLYTMPDLTDPDIRKITAAFAA
jgi:hypothetical protein